jgi:hypothetical protein
MISQDLLVFLETLLKMKNVEGFILGVVCCSDLRLIAALIDPKSCAHYFNNEFLNSNLLMYQPDKVAVFVHKIVSIYVQQVAFGCIPRNQLITYFLVHCSFQSLCFSGT